MATYCTPEDLGRVGLNAKALEVFSATDQELRAIQMASARIDGYLNRRYVLPLLTFGDDLRECCAVLAVWSLMAARGFKPNENPEDSNIYLRNKEMLAWLKLIADGDVVLDVTQSPVPSVGAPGAPRISSNESRGYQGGRGTFSGQRR